MTKNLVIQACEKHVKEFKGVVDQTGYEVKGIFNSEMLMLVSIVRELDVKIIIESGRARGQSTAIISKFLRDAHRIRSVEADRYTRDSLIALKRLHKYTNLELHFGDAFKLVPNLIEDRCCLLIDGPKGYGALRLAVDALRNKQVEAVFIHDVQLDTPHRTAMQNLFKTTFFSDDADFVQAFRYLDEVCWSEQEKIRPDWGPYRRGDQRMKSYSATLGVAFNGRNAISEDACQAYFGKKERALTEVLYGKAKAVRRHTPKLVQVPFWFALYHLEQVRLMRGHE